jgi:hypothetical protein
VLHRVRCTVTNPGHADRVAERIYATGESTWHASWVLSGSDGQGCSCTPCRDAR